jgi:hypothetical protein
MTRPTRLHDPDRDIIPIRFMDVSDASLDRCLRLLIAISVERMFFLRIVSLFKRLSSSSGSTFSTRHKAGPSPAGPFAAGVSGRRRPAGGGLNRRGLRSPAAGEPAVCGRARRSPPTHISVYLAAQRAPSEVLAPDPPPAESCWHTGATELGVRVWCACWRVEGQEDRTVTAGLWGTLAL